MQALKRLNGFGNYDKFGGYYDASEADKEIAELTQSLEQVKRAAHTLRKKMTHQKHKRCLAMASNCRLRARWFGDNAFYKKEQWALQWHRRWLKIAEKFKEAK